MSKEICNEAIAGKVPFSTNPKIIFNIAGRKVRAAVTNDILQQLREESAVTILPEHDRSKNVMVNVREFNAAFPNNPYELICEYTKVLTRFIHQTEVAIAGKHKQPLTDKELAQLKVQRARILDMLKQRHWRTAFVVDRVLALYDLATLVKLFSGGVRQGQLQGQYLTELFRNRVHADTAIVPCRTIEEYFDAWYGILSKPIDITPDDRACPYVPCIKKLRDKSAYRKAASEKDDFFDAPDACTLMNRDTSTQAEKCEQIVLPARTTAEEMLGERRCYDIACDAWISFVLTFNMTSTQLRDIISFVQPHYVDAGWALRVGEHNTVVAENTVRIGEGYPMADTIRVDKISQMAKTADQIYEAFLIYQEANDKLRILFK